MQAWSSFLLSSLGLTARNGRERGERLPTGCIPVSEITRVYLGKNKSPWQRMDPDKISLWDRKCLSGMVIASRCLDKGAALPHSLHKLSGLDNPMQFSAKSNVCMEEAPTL